MERRSREEYLQILDAFRRMLYSLENSAESVEHFTDMVIYRAAALIDRALSGLGIEFERAIALLRSSNNDLTERDEMERERLVAAFDNLIEFATAQEYAMIQELPDKLDLSDMVLYERICEKYNDHYASVEDEQVYHAACMAAFWMGVSEQSYITYNTQNDERVRAWHQSYNGLSYRKSEFPPELIPPIDWACRCFLTGDGVSSVRASILKPEIVVDPIFSESLATCGRIFSNAHPYFKHHLPKEVEAKIVSSKSLHLEVTDEVIIPHYTKLCTQQ